MKVLHVLPVLAATTCVLARPLPSSATVVPNGFVHEHLVGAPFTSEPVAFAFLPDGRFVLVERPSGIVRVAAAGSNVSIAVATIPNVNSNHPERGLLGVAVDPQWPARPFWYFLYTATDSTEKVAMWETLGDLQDPNSTQITLANPFVLLDDIDDLNGIHNAGTLRFASDGTLLVSLGDDNRPCLAQDLGSPRGRSHGSDVSETPASPLGKLLRLDVSGMPQGGSGPPPLTDLVPSGNPFPGPGWAALVYAWGLRNPFRFDVDPATRDVFIGNVGSHLFEEVELVPASAPGLNFGWPQYENTTALGCCGDCGEGNTFTFPIHAIPHPADLISIIGGPMMRTVPGSDLSFPSTYEGDYFYAEIFSGRISRLRKTGSTWDFAPTVPGQPALDAWAAGFVGLCDFQRGSDGALYLVSLGNQGVLLPRGLHRIRPLSGTVGVPEVGATSLHRIDAQPNPMRHGASVVLRVAPGTPAHGWEIFDAAGKRVRSFEAQTAEIVWDGRDAAGREVSAGIYVVRARTAHGVVSAKLTRLR